MKKSILLFTVVLSFLFNYLNGQTVYITKTGEKYHQGDCRYLSHSKYEIELKNAIDQGYEACKVCKPSQTVQTKKENTGANSSTETQAKNATSTQCTGTTKAGNQCKHMTKSKNRLCWQHGG